MKNSKYLSKGKTSDWYTSVYIYDDKLYFLSQCTICDQIAVPVNCEGIPLCDLDEYIEEVFSETKEVSCMSEFYKNAEYQFNIVKK